MAVAAARVRLEIRLDYGPLLDDLGLPEIVGRMCHDEYWRGYRDGSGKPLSIPSFDDGEFDVTSWVATAREELAEALSGRH